MSLDLLTVLHQNFFLISFFVICSTIKGDCNSFITEPHLLKKSWHFFNLAFEPPAHLNMFCHFILCEFAWSGFCMDTTESHSLRSCETTNKKDPTLESISGLTFSEYEEKNLALHRQSLAILQSTFCHLLITALS